jgi:hypothetical protein
MSVSLYIGAGRDARPLFCGPFMQSDEIVFVDDMSYDGDRDGPENALRWIARQLDAGGVSHGDPIEERAGGDWMQYSMDVAGKRLIYMAGASDWDLLRTDLLLRTVRMWVCGFVPWHDEDLPDERQEHPEVTLRLGSLREVYVQNLPWVLSAVSTWLPESPGPAVRRIDDNVFFGPLIDQGSSEEYLRLADGSWRPVDVRLIDRWE